MAQLSDTIEKFIKDLMEQDTQVELRRNELAQHFGTNWLGESAI